MASTSSSFCAEEKLLLHFCGMQEKVIVDKSIAEEETGNDSVMTTKAEHFTKVEFAGGNKCEEQNSKVLVHDEKEDVLDEEADPDTNVEIVGGYKCEEHDPKVEVHVEKEAVLEKYSPENGDQTENFPSSMKGNEMSTRDTSPSILKTIQMMQRERKRNMRDGAARKPTKDVEGQTKTSKDQLEKEIGENSNMESGRKDATTSNIDNLDNIITMIAKSIMKDPPDSSEDMKIIIKKSEPPEETSDESVDANGDATCASGAVGASGASDDMDIIIDKYELPWEDGDASVEDGGAIVGAGSAGEDTYIIIEKSESPQEDCDASGDIGGEESCAGGAIGAGEDTKMIIEKSKQPQEYGDGSVDASGDASCAGGANGAAGAGEDMEIIIEKFEPPQEDGDAFVDAGGDGSCAIGAKYVRHNDGMMPWQREDGGGAGGVADYVRNDDGTVSCPWEDLWNILFESKPALILDINGVLLTSAHKWYCSQMPAY
ncbi:hypothetical protein L7F22_039878 [Adiantum nelumboides]|nr:hypothetical protein [Adiantum nelumboides]